MEKELKKEIEELKKGISFIGKSAGKRVNVHFDIKKELIQAKEKELKIFQEGKKQGRTQQKIEDLKEINRLKKENKILSHNLHKLGKYAIKSQLSKEIK